MNKNNKRKSSTELEAEVANVQEKPLTPRVSKKHKSLETKQGSSDVQALQGSMSVNSGAVATEKRIKDNARGSNPDMHKTLGEDILDLPEPLVSLPQPLPVPLPAPTLPVAALSLPEPTLPDLHPLPKATITAMPPEGLPEATLPLATLPHANNMSSCESLTLLPEPLPSTGLALMSAASATLLPPPPLILDLSAQEDVLPPVDYRMNKEVIVIPDCASPPIIERIHPPSSRPPHSSLELLPPPDILDPSQAGPVNPSFKPSPRPPPSKPPSLLFQPLPLHIHVQPSPKSQSSSKSSASSTSLSKPYPINPSPSSSSSKTARTPSTRNSTGKHTGAMFKIDYPSERGKKKKKRKPVKKDTRVKKTKSKRRPKERKSATDDHNVVSDVDAAVEFLLKWMTSADNDWSEQENWRCNNLLDRIQSKKTQRLSKEDQEEFNRIQSRLYRTTKLTEDQIARLEEFFQQDSYPSTEAKKSFALELGVTFLRVNNWFHQRRSKQRKAGLELQRKSASNKAKARQLPAAAPPHPHPHNGNPSGLSASGSGRSMSGNGWWNASPPNATPSRIVATNSQMTYAPYTQNLDISPAVALRSLTTARQAVTAENKHWKEVAKKWGRLDPERARLERDGRRMWLKIEIDRKQRIVRQNALLEGHDCLGPGPSEINYVLQQMEDETKRLEMERQAMVETRVRMEKDLAKLGKDNEIEVSCKS